MNKKNEFYKYFVIASNYTYTLVSPVILMIVLYYVFSKYVFLSENNFVLILMILLGLISGYWSLYKEINIENKKKKNK